MWSSRRRLALLAPLVLAACGFTPVYGPGGTGSALQNRVEVGAPSERDSFLLVRRIEERIGRATVPAYDLTLGLQTIAAGLEIDPEGNTNRFNLVGRATYVLTDRATGARVTEGEVEAFTGYSVTSSTSAARAAERDAAERLMVILGDLIVTRLLAADLPR